MGDRAWTAGELRALALPVAAAVVLAAGAARVRFGFDDAFISFRYAANLASGLGLVFNPGEPVEGYSCLAWVLALAGLRRLGAPLLVSAHVLGIAAGSATVIAAGLTAARLARRRPAVASAVAALLVALDPGFRFWTASAMETSTFALLVLLGTATAIGARAPASAGLLCGLAALTRPEGLLFGLAAGAAVALAGGWTAVRRFAPGFLGLVLGAEVFRLVYYGSPLPNTFYAKVGVQFGNGVWYLRQFVRRGGWVYVFALAALTRPQRGTAVLWLGTAAVYLAWVASIGGDAFAFYRFVVPVVPLLAVLAGLGIEAVLAVRPAAAASALATAGVFYGLALRSAHAEVATVAHGLAALTARGRVVGLALRGAPRGTTVAMLSVGVVPFYAGPAVRIVDMLGLTDAHVARHGTPVPDGLPGHARYDSAYVLARQPDLILLHPPVLPSCARPLTAAAVRTDPCGTAFIARVGAETGLAGQRCPPAPPPGCPYVLPARLDFERPEVRAQLEASYEHVTALAGIGEIDVYRRRGWREMSGQPAPWQPAQAEVRPTASSDMPSGGRSRRSSRRRGTKRS